MGKRVFATILLCAALMSLMPTTARAEYGGPLFHDGLHWTLNDSGVLTISGNGAMPDYNSGDCPQYCSSINDVYIGPLVKTFVVSDGVTRVGDYALSTKGFNWKTTSNVIEAYIASSVESIGQYALWSSLESIYIYGDNTKIEDHAITPNATIYCYAGSEAEAFAKQNGNKIVLMCKTHVWSDWSEVKPASEDEEGEEVRSCTVCGETESRTIARLPHTHQLIESAKEEPTCTETGTEAYWTCLKCHKLFSDSNGDHEIAAPISIAAHGHDLIIANQKEATCTEMGYSGDKVCTICNEVVEKGLPISMKDHTWSAWETTKPATVSSEGEETRTCSVCNKSEYRKTGKLPTPEKCDGGVSCPSIILSDVDRSENSWYHEAVDWAYTNGITKGTSDTLFSPDATCTRAQVVTFLWRAQGSPTPNSSENPFNDVKQSDYYYMAVLWANENRITNGTSEDTFSPNNPCTRAQVVTFLWRTESSPKLSAPNPFNDVAVGSYYSDAVLWAVNHTPQITKGTSDTLFSPESPCTRSQVVTFLFRDLK